MLSKSCFRIFISLVGLTLLAKRCKAQYEDEFGLGSNPLTNNAMQFIVEYANWRKLDHIIIFDSFLQRGSIPMNLMQLLDCLSQQGLYSSMYSTKVQFSRDIFRVTRHRLGVVVLLRCNETLDYSHVLLKASRERLFDEQHSWLLINCAQEQDFVLNLIQTISLGLTTDLIVATSLQTDTSYTDTGKVTDKFNFTCPVTLPKKTFINDSFSKDIQVHVQPPIKQSSFGPNLEPNKNLFKTSLSEVPTVSKPETSFSRNSVFSGISPEKLSFELIQVYKIRKEDNSSIITTTLGSWSPIIHFDKMVPFSPVEGRQDLMGFPLIVGFTNWTTFSENAGYQSGKSKVFDIDVDDTENLLEIMGFIAKSLNATVKYVPFQSLGTEIQDGVWSELLNAVVKGEVDFGLEKVTVSYHKLDYMAFTHNIMKMSHNIYMHPSEFSVSKDIYLTPFSSKLLLCVLGMAILLALIMLIISAVANHRAKKNNTDTESVNVSYAALWIVGILSMQGSVWTPISSSGNMTLISSLMFAVIIYNSYAAFITSILSVKTSDINSLDDLFDNGYKVGYIKDSLDENYLQKQTDELKNIYLRGYNSKVDNIEEGLVLAAKTKYALFVSTQAARRAIQVLSPYECRCQIQEFSLRQTVENVAFPLNKSSPYHKIVNLGVLRLIESGTLSRIEGYMLPEMPTCSSDSSFVSAQLEDVFTAVKLLIMGVVLSLVVAIGECVVRYRKSLRSNMKRSFFRAGNKIKQTVENFEF